METKELIVHLNKDIVITNQEIVDSVNGLSNESSGFMALKSVCMRENLNTDDVFKWVRDKGWLEEWPEVTTKAIIDWHSMGKGIDTIKGTFKACKECILIQIINNSHYVNTKSIHYNSFIQELRDTGITGSYNRDVKEAEPKLTTKQLTEIRKLYKVVYR